VKEFEEVSMRCSTGYRGGWAPSIHWQDGNGQRITAGVSSLTNSSHVTSVLTLTASTSHHGVVYSCVILFENHSQTLPQANVWSNTPSYRHTCSLPALNISCKLTIIALLSAYLDEQLLQSLATWYNLGLFFDLNVQVAPRCQPRELMA